MANISQRGLEGVTVTDSQVGLIVGAPNAEHPDLDEGLLYYRGIDIRELAPNATFEETAFLLWEGRLPTRAELAAETAALVAGRTLAPEVVAAIKSFPKDGVSTMDILRTAVSVAGLYDPDRDAAFSDLKTNRQKAARLTAQVAVMVAAYDRHRHGLEPVAADPELSLAANFLYQLRGEKPSADAARTMDLALILHAEHGFNASTFSSRVTIATEADLHSAICSAIGTLKGPLHGGANARALATFEDIGTVDNVVPWLEDHLARHQKIMGLGHRVYKVRDPRATILQKQADRLVHEAGDTTLYDIATKLEQEFVARMAKKGKPELQANVDFYSGVVYKMMGIATDLFTPVFAIARMAGWCAHVLEQMGDNRLIRPRCKYTGRVAVPFTPIDKRTA